MSELPNHNEFEVNFTSCLGDATELALMTGEEVSLDPITLGMGEQSIEELTSAEKAAAGRAIWAFFGLPKGNELLKESTTVHGETRQRIINTNQEGIVINELLSPDGQKRFTVGSAPE